MSNRYFKCKTCGAWWTRADPDNTDPPRRCYGDCGGTDFETGEIKKATADGAPWKATP